MELTPEQRLAELTAVTVPEHVGVEWRLHLRRDSAPTGTVLAYGGRWMASYAGNGYVVCDTAQEAVDAIIAHESIAAAEREFEAEVRAEILRRREAVVAS